MPRGELGVDYDIVSIDNAAEPTFGFQEPGPHLLVTHPQRSCDGEFCTIHNPSPHHMREWTLNWRGDRGLMERICPCHGVGHPDPDDIAYHERNGREGMGVHGCFGCC